MSTRQWDASEPSPKGIDPPTRLNWINNMKPHLRATALLRLYLDKRCTAVDRTEAKLCRSMLKSLNEIQADGNEMGVELAIMHAKQGAVQIFFNIHGSGPVTWLPMLVLQSNVNLEHIIRETGPNRVGIDRTAYCPPDPDAEPRKRRVPPKIEAALVRGGGF